MKRIVKSISTLLMLISLAASVQASEAVDQLLQGYREQGAAEPDPTAGAALWMREQEGRSCSSCHTPDPRQTGKHRRTGKTIEPMAPSVNAARLTETRQIRKWLLRNCKWTFGRECSAQEKSDFLVWMQNQ